MGHWTRRDILKSGMAASAATPFRAAAAQSAPAGNSAAQPAREQLLLDFGWRFHPGHADDPARDFGLGKNGETFAKSGGFVAPGNAAFDDSAWSKVDLPHDWAVELPFVNAPELIAHGCKPLGRQYPATSIGWYRRVFDLPATDSGRRLSLEFDGVFRDAVVVFNNHYIGRNMSGYAPFHLDVTDFATCGGSNVLVLRVDATLNEGWFYEGAGIYRHVWLTKTSSLHVAHWGTFVRSAVGPAGAAISVTTEADNDGDVAAECRVRSTIVDANGKSVVSAQTDSFPVSPWGRRAYEQQIALDKPALWSVEKPYLYRLVTEIESAGGMVDRHETSFGIRTIRFDADRGFFLNGERVEIKGTCNHQDHAGVGAALPDRLQSYRVARLKEMGSNAYRTSHNPPTPELLDACDRLGMLVMDETRMMSSNPEGLSQLERLVRRDRNHPSVVIWSLGNEEREQGSERGARIVTTMKRLARRLDPSRPVTVAMNNSWGRGVSAVVDVQGFNYNDSKIDDFRRKFPRQPLIGTETGSTVSTRGIYTNDKQKGYVSAYDLNFPPWAATAETWWRIYHEREFLAGGFAWTGFDYRGEPTPYGWPCINSHFGIMDVCGFPKDNFYYYQAVWASKPVLHLFPHWNWEGKEGQEIEVWCYSNLERVELLLNGKSLGSKPVVPDSHLMWKVNYTPGTIEAKGFNGARLVLNVRRETSGAPSRIVLYPDRVRIAADGEDIAIVVVEVVDQRNRPAPHADNEILFRVNGPGTLIGVGNGDPSSHEPDKADRRRAFNGLCMAIVQSARQPGDVTVEASGAGLEGASVTIQCKRTSPRPAVA